MTELSQEVAVTRLHEACRYAVEAEADARRQLDAATRLESDMDALKRAATTASIVLSEAGQVLAAGRGDPKPHPTVDPHTRHLGGPRMRLWHATRHLDAVLADGWVRPMRMPHVYTFSSEEAAKKYATEFGYEAVVEVEIELGAGLIAGRWSPSYASGADVVMLRGPAHVVGCAP